MILQSTILCNFKMSGYTENIRIAKKYILELFYKKLKRILDNLDVQIVF